MTGDDVAVVQALSVAGVALTWLVLRYRAGQKAAEHKAALEALKVTRP